MEDALNRIASCAFCLLLLCPPAPSAQTKPGASGHWEGSITLPTGELKVVVDLDKDPSGIWVGDIDIPDQGAKDLSLRAVTVSGEVVSFDLSADPNGPKFKGKLSADGNTLAGDFIQAGNTFPMSMKRTGDAKVYVQPKNAVLPDKYTGKWEGSLSAMGNTLRLVFNLGNKGNSAEGTIDSLDQNAMGIPMDEIAVAENGIKISVKVVGGSFSGKLDEDGKVLTGEWTQLGNTLPLVLKKAAAK